MPEYIAKMIEQLKELKQQLEEQKEQHQKALIRKDDEMHDLRKKMKNMSK